MKTTLQIEDTVILCEVRGDYITNFRPDGEILGGDMSDALHYTHDEAQRIIEELGRGFSAEKDESVK